MGVNRCSPWRRLLFTDLYEDVHAVCLACTAARLAASSSRHLNVWRHPGEIVRATPVRVTARPDPGRLYPCAAHRIDIAANVQSGLNTSAGIA